MPKDLAWENFYDWVKRLLPDNHISGIPTSSALRATLSRLQSKVKVLKRKKEQEKIRLLMSKPLIVLKTHDATLTCASVKSTKPIKLDRQSEILSTVNQELATELAVTKEALELEEKRTQDLVSKLSKLSVRNTNKKPCRRDEQITNLKLEAMEHNSFKVVLSKVNLQLNAIELT